VQGVAQVAVVKPDETVDMRKVTPGARVGSLWVIGEGLNLGERVVVEGADRLRPGQKIHPEPSASPDAPTHK
jgi:multidrug efflux pump subunit AcrA (membrane-fusion protein)